MAINNLEIELLRFWKERGVEWLYKYKHRVKEYREGNNGENRHHFELFLDISSGAIFRDIKDIANYPQQEEIYPQDIKVHIDTLITARVNAVE